MKKGWLVFYNDVVGEFRIFHGQVKDLKDGCFAEGYAWDYVGKL